MTKTSATKPTGLPVSSEPKTKNQQVIDLLSTDGGVTLEEMSTLAGWQPHSTRSFITSLKKNGHVIESDKIDGVRRYRITSNGGA
jgi:DNA-binding IclR family transcriptional regulator